MKSVIVAAFVAILCLVTATTAHALSSVNVTKARLYTGAYVYTASIDHATSVAVSLRDSAYLPLALGGCHLVYHVNTRNHAKIIDSLYCDAPGTIAFRTPPVYNCGVTFTLTANDGPDATVWTDQITEPCPPPPPPGVVVSSTDTTITFTNPATVEQSKVFSTTVLSLETTYTSTDPFTYSVTIRFAGIGLNRYTYAEATFGVTLAPNQTITLERNQ